MVRTEVPSDRGTIYDRSGTVALATTSTATGWSPSRPSSWGERRRREQALAGSGRDRRRRWSTILGLGGDGRRRRCAERLASGKAYVVLARDLDAAQSAAVRAAIASRQAPARAPGARGRARLPARGRRPEDDARGPGPRASSTARAAASTGSRPAGRRRSPAPRGSCSPSATPRASRTSRRRRPCRPAAPAPTSRSRSTPASSSPWSARSTRPGWRTGRRASPPSSMDPKTGEILAEATYPSYDANAYAAVATKDPGRFVDPDRRVGLRAGLRLQDDHRGRRPRGRGRDPHVTRQRPGGPAPRRRQGLVLQNDSLLCRDLALKREEQKLKGLLRQRIQLEKQLQTLDLELAISDTNLRAIREHWRADRVHFPPT